MTLIYALSDDWCNVRYVGKTKRLLQRLYHHFSDQSNSPKAKWIRAMRKQKRPVFISILAVCDGDGDAEEKSWIMYYTARGDGLVNQLNGGLGATRDYPPEATRRHLSESHRGKVQSPETKAKRSEAMRRAWAEHPRSPVSAETRKKMSESGKRKPPMSEEARAKIGAAVKARPPMSDETRQKHREARARQAPLTEEGRENKKAAALRRAKPSEATKQKMSESHRRRLQDPAQKAALQERARKLGLSPRGTPHNREEKTDERA